MSPKPADVTPELLAEMRAREEEWDENAGSKLVIPRSYIEGCKKCWGDDRESHDNHATQEELEADRDARRWIIDRITVAAA
jgi:hypothetical protein